MCAYNYQAKIYAIWNLLIPILIQELAQNAILWALCTISK
jgi:hypothetical protein